MQVIVMCSALYYSRYVQPVHRIRNSINTLAGFYQMFDESDTLSILWFELEKSLKNYISRPKYSLFFLISI